jgi:hypothetical protein
MRANVFKGLFQQCARMMQFPDPTPTPYGFLRKLICVSSIASNVRATVHESANGTYRLQLVTPSVKASLSRIFLSVRGCVWSRCVSVSLFYLSFTQSYLYLSHSSLTTAHDFSVLLQRQFHL